MMKAFIRFCCLLACLTLILGRMGAAELDADAFVGLPDDTPESVFAPPALGNLPAELRFTYSIPDHRLLPSTYRVTPLNVGNSDPLTWTVAAGGDWFTAAPLSGTTPASFWITPTAFSTSTVAIYTGTVTVTAVNPIGTTGSPHRIALTLWVTDTALSRACFPLAMRDYGSHLYPNDPYYSTQWALEKVEAPAAWGFSTGQGVLVAIIDTGTDLDHPDLADKVRTDIDWDYVNNDESADDDHGHGTHVSGVAAAATDNGVGVAGLGWRAMLLPLKMLGADGYGSDTNLAAAIRYAADHGAGVINMSLGGDVPCPTVVQDAVDYAYGKGLVLVAAAGNDLGNREMFPANCRHVLGVAATNSDDSVASYSNSGDHVSVAAPGSGIYSTLRGGGYGTMSGTSMATAHVAGLAALLRAHYLFYTPDEIASAILDNAEDVGAAGWDEHSGCGRINAFKALSAGAHGASPLCLGVRTWAMESAATSARVSFVPGEVIVALRSGVNAETVFSRHTTDVDYLPALRVWRLRVRPGQEQATLSRLRGDPAVVYAELDYLVSAQ